MVGGNGEEKERAGGLQYDGRRTGGGSSAAGGTFRVIIKPVLLTSKFFHPKTALSLKICFFSLTDLRFFQKFPSIFLLFHVITGF